MCSNRPVLPQDKPYPVRLFTQAPPLYNVSIGGWWVGGGLGQWEGDIYPGKNAEKFPDLAGKIAGLKNW